MGRSIVTCSDTVAIGCHVAYHLAKMHFVSDRRTDGQSRLWWQ